ncbi:MAG: DinB family protein [Bacteroidetes bacterium]|nr:DinB family protein [Bacteroidota bacterium]
MNNHYLNHVLVMLEQVEKQVTDDFCNLTREQINWRPDPKSWSIAECLDHLSVTNQQYFKVFENIKGNQLRTSLWAKIPGWDRLGASMVLKTVDPENQKKYKTFKVFRPSSSDYTRSVVDDFLNNQHQLVALIHELDGYENHNKIIVNSPVSKVISFSLETALNVAWKHAVRHLMQANRLRLLDGFPQSSTS